MQLKDLTPEQAQRLSALLDEALDLAPGQRDAWLGDLAQREAQLCGLVNDLLASMGAAGRQHLLETKDLIERRFAQAGLDASSLEGRVFGSYRVLRLLGQGGMGSVWLAERADGLFARQVALKLVHAHLIGHALTERFARERSILAALAHPHIARLLDAGVSAEGQPYLALEYVDGTPLTAYCDAERLNVRARVSLAVQVLSAVQHAHQNLVVHRDLKPSNILVTREGQTQLLDFGIAKLMVEGEARETELTQVGGRALTLDYASPEQIAGEPISTASDVYSMGVVLYELLCGSRLYDLKRDSRGALEEAILSAAPAKPSQSAITDEIATARATTATKLRQALGGDLDTIVLKALKKNPAERYPTADAFMQDLQHHLAGEPVAARPDSTTYRVGKFVARNSLAVMTAALTVVAVGVSLGAALWQAGVARQEARTSAAVQGFLKEIFLSNAVGQSDPAKARQTTARELLDAGSKKIDAQLNDAPFAKLDVLKTLSQMYEGIGLYDEATQLLRKHVALAKSYRSISHSKVAEALLDLADLLQNGKSPQELEAVLKEASQTLDKDSAPDVATRAKLLAQMAHYYSGRDPLKAIAFAQQSVSLARTQSMPEELGAALDQLADQYAQEQQYALAEPLLVESLALTKSRPDRGRAELPRTYAYLADLQSQMGKFSEAEINFRLATQAARDKVEEMDRDVLETMRRLGQFLVMTSRMHAGIRSLKETTDSAIKAFGREDPFTTTYALIAYGVALGRFGDLEQGLHYTSQGVENWRRDRPGTAILAVAIDRRAALLIDLGRYDEAQTALDDAASISQKMQKAPAYLLEAQRLTQAALLTATNRADDALRLLQSLNAIDVDLGRLSIDWARHSLAKAQVELALNQTADAHRIAADMTERITHSPSREYLKIYEAGAALVEGKVRLRTRDPSSALPFLKQAVDLDSALYDPERSPELADAQIALADCLIELGDRREAGILLEKAKAIHSAQPNLGEQFKTSFRAVAARLAARQAT